MDGWRMSGFGFEVSGSRQDANGDSHLMHRRFYASQASSTSLYHNHLYQEMDFLRLVSSINEVYSTLFHIDDWRWDGRAGWTVYLFSFFLRSQSFRQG